MFAQTTPFPAMPSIIQGSPLYEMAIPSTEALLRDVTEQLASVQKMQVKNKRRYQNWKAIAANPTGHDSVLGGNMLFSFLLEGLFGLPLFSGISDMARIGAHMGGLQLADQPSAQRYADEDDMEATRKSYRQASTHNAAQEKQLQMWQQMTMMLLAAMLHQMQQQGGNSGKGDEDLVPDILRHPKMARFKQNRASIACIRTMFQRQADAVAPRYTAPKYVCA